MHSFHWPAAHETSRASLDIIQYETFYFHVHAVKIRHRYEYNEYEKDIASFTVDANE